MAFQALASFCNNKRRIKGTRSNEQDRNIVLGLDSVSLGL